MKKKMTIQYRSSRMKVSSLMMGYVLLMNPTQLAQFLYNNKLINPAIDVTRLQAYWYKDNTIRLFLNGEKLTGVTGLPKGGA